MGNLLEGKCPHCGSGKVEYITRVTGFFSKVGSWNKGKIGELKDRRSAISENQASFASAVKASSETAPSKSMVKLFWKNDCPRCPAAKEVAHGIEAKGYPVSYYNVDDVEGLAEASAHMVMSTPTTVIVDGEDNELESWRGVPPDASRIEGFFMGNNFPGH